MATAFWTSSDSYVQPARETAVGRLPMGGAPQGAWPQGSVTETQSSLRLRPSHPALFGGDAAFGPRLETAAAPGAPLAPAQWPVPAQRPARTWERRLLGARGSGLGPSRMLVCRGRRSEPQAEGPDDRRRLLHGPRRRESEAEAPARSAPRPRVPGTDAAFDVSAPAVETGEPEAGGRSEPPRPRVRLHAGDAFINRRNKLC